MKEITAVMTVQLTVIGQFTDEKAAEWLEGKEQVTKGWLNDLKEEFHIDDLLLLKNQTFVRDMEG